MAAAGPARGRWRGRRLLLPLLLLTAAIAGAAAPDSAAGGAAAEPAAHRAAAGASDPGVHRAAHRAAGRVAASPTPPAVWALPQAGIVRWVWSGAVTPESAVVKARLEEGASEVRLLVTEEPDFGPARLVPASGYATPDDDGIVAFEVDRLVPDREYYYAIEVAGRRVEEGAFRTFPQGAASFRLVFGSCATTGSDHEVFDTMRGLDPLFLLHMGDFHYEDIDEPDPGAYLDAYDEVLTSRTQGALFRSVPVAYVWDDHDYGPNDADRTAPGRQAALATYRRVVPHYPLTDAGFGRETIQQAFTAGRVRFLLTDTRAQRDPIDWPDGPEKSMLGRAQRDWLFRELEAARGRHALVVWVNVVPWITRADAGGDHGWQRYSFERTLIADRIKELDLVDRMLMLSGDAHMVAIDDGSNSNYASDREAGERGFPVVHAGPFDRYPRVKGGPYSHGTVAPRSWFGLGKVQQFGLMEVRDDGDVLRVELSGRDEDGDVLEGMLLRVRCDPAGCRPVTTFIEG